MVEFSVAASGGSGNIPRINPFEEPLSDALIEAERIVRLGGTAIEAVVRGVTILEDHPRLNAGHGSALSEDGGLNMEAAIMYGADLSAGAVSGLDTVCNPIQLAELVRLDPTVVKLAGESAVEVARAHGMQLVAPGELVTDRQRRRLARQQATGELVIDGAAEGKLGTVGVVAKDRYGNTAAGTSTGGLLGGPRRRVADTSTIGAGTYANRHAAVSATGKGEDFIRVHAAGTVGALMQHAGLALEEAVARALHEVEAIGGKGGLIAVDYLGAVTSAKTATTRGLAHGAITSEMGLRISLDPAEVTGVA